MLEAPGRFSTVPGLGCVCEREAATVAPQRCDGQGL